MAPIVAYSLAPPPAQFIGRDLQFIDGNIFKCDGPCDPAFVKTCIIIAGLWMYAGLMYLLVEYGLSWSFQSDLRRN